MQAIEGVSHFAATGLLAHQGLEAQDFLDNPVGLLSSRQGHHQQSDPERGVVQSLGAAAW